MLFQFYVLLHKGSEDLLNNRHKIKRLPVKILGEAATFEELPRSSKGIPEVVSG